MDNGFKRIIKNIDRNVQPDNINQIISFLISVADVEGYLKPQTKELIFWIGKDSE